MLSLYLFTDQKAKYGTKEEDSILDKLGKMLQELEEMVSNMIIINFSTSSILKVQYNH